MRKICLALFAAYLLSPDLRAEPVVASQEPGARAAKTKPSKTKNGTHEYASDAEARFVDTFLKNRHYAGGYDTSVFEGHHTYLLEDDFLECGNSVIDYDMQPNGWDVDRRGGRLRGDGVHMCLMDGDPDNVVSLSHRLMTHRKGDLVLETAMIMKSSRHDGFSYALTGGGRMVLRLETQGDHIGLITGTGAFAKISPYIPDVLIPIKATVHMDKRTVDVIVGDAAEAGIPFAQDASVIDTVTISTSRKGEMTTALPFVHIHINYLVNERFLTTAEKATPGDWTLNGAGAGNAGTAVMESQRVDTRSYRLTTSGAHEHPRIFKPFDTKAKKLTTEFYVLIPQKNDGGSISLMNGHEQALSIGTKDGGFVLNGDRVIYADYVADLWYRFKIKTDADSGKASVTINYNKVADHVELGSRRLINGIEFSSGTNEGAVFWLDDVSVYESLPLMQGYPSKPRTVTPADGVEIGMIMYSMWREGGHFGWDRMSPYEERIPYLGYYTEGCAETADWETKWLVEHGVTYQILPFCGVTTSKPEPIKKPIRGHALIDGLLTAEYKMAFCIMWSSAKPETIGGLDDFKANILPFWIEYYFKNPNYMKISGKILIYTYATDKIAQCLGGAEAFKNAIGLMDDAARTLGFDGAIVVANEAMPPDQAKELGIYKYRYGWDSAADDGEAVKKGITAMMETGDFRKFIPSVCQGYNTTPWRINSVGFMTPEEIDTIFSYLAQNRAKWLSMGNPAANIITLTCWNEWGEGHFYAPSTLHGFSYMNAVRKTFTKAGTLDDEQFPDARSLARMGVLYPEGRQTLKLMPDQVTASAGETLVPLAKIDFSKTDDFARLEIGNGVKNMRSENGMLAADAVKNDPSIYINNLDIDAAQVRQINVGAGQANGATFTVYYQTTDDPVMGKNNKRFAGSLVGLGVQNLTLLPAAKNKLKGKITRMRIDPDDNTYGEFRVSRIDILGTEKKDVAVVIDGHEYDNNTPIRTVDGTSCMSIYKYFYATERANIVWHRREGRLHLDYKKYSLDFVDGQKEYTVNGMTHEFKTAPFYADGNFFVPIKAFFEAIGFDVVWNSEEQRFELTSETGRQLARRETPEPGKWEFDVDGYLDGWSIGSSNRKTIVKDGVLRMSPDRSPATMSISGLSLKSSDYRYAIIRLENRSDADCGRFYFLNEHVTRFGKDAGYSFDLSRNDTSFNDYVIDLTANRHYKGTIIQLRLDLAGQDGAIHVDSIRLTKDVPNAK